MGLRGEDEEKGKPIAEIYFNKKELSLCHKL